MWRSAPIKLLVGSKAIQPRLGTRASTQAWDAPSSERYLGSPASSSLLLRWNMYPLT